MSILERRKLKAATLAISGPVAVLAVVGVSAGKSQAAAITSTDILVYQGGSSSTDIVAAGGSTLLIQELDPSLTSQTPVQTFNITNESTPLYTNANGSNGILTLSQSGTTVLFGGYLGTNATNELTQNSRAIGALDASGTYTQAATYNESSSGTGNGQVRTAYSPDGSNYYIGDKAGLYLGGSNGVISNTTNIRALHGYGSTLYASFQGNATTPAIYTVSSDGTTLTAVSGITGNKNLTDFVLLSSGANGSTFDTAYLAEGTAIAKYGLISGTWTAEGTITASGSINGITAAELGSNSGAELYYTTTTGAFSVEDTRESEQHRGGWNGV